MKGFDCNIYLSGFMGCGKTTVGQVLAARLGWTFVDTDRLIEHKSGYTIAEIFLRFGEEDFRQRERDVLARLSLKKHLVVSLGGGMVADPRNQEKLKKGFWVFLCVPMSIILTRLKNDRARPLARMTAEKLIHLYQMRLPHYKRAHLTLHGQQLMPEAIAKKILHKLNRVSIA